MPYKVTKTKSGKYQVRSPHGVKAKGTTKTKAERQRRLLQAVKHSNWRPTGAKAKR